MELRSSWDPETTMAQNEKKKEEKRTNICVDIGSEGSLELDRNKGADSMKEWTAFQSTNLPVPCP
jgi:hypothetical protein